MQRFVQTGDIVGGSTRLFTIADVNTLVTQLPVSELEVPFLRVGSVVSVRVDALGRDVSGRIRRIFPAADSSSRLVPVEVAITGAQQAQGGMALGDVITKFDKIEIKRSSDLFRALDAHKVGDEVELELMRDGEKRTVKVTLEGLQ
jgi:S1-C subfamily serine protease